MMDDKQIEELLSLGTIDEQIAELLREVSLAEIASDATRGHKPTVNAGNVVVPNYGDAIGGMFARGREDKRREEAKAELGVQRADRDRIVKDYGDAVTGRTLEDLSVRTPRVGTPPPVNIAAEQAVLAQPAPPRPAPQPAMQPAIPGAAPPQAPPQAPGLGNPPPRPPVPPAQGAAMPPPTPEELIALLREGRGATGSY